MRYLTIAAILVFSVWIIYFTFAQLRRCHFNAKWWAAFGLLALVGLFGGIWAGTLLEYQPSARIKIHGFPLPLAIFVLEEQGWTDFVPSHLVQYCRGLANISVAVAVALIPLTLAARISRRDTVQPG